MQIAKFNGFEDIGHIKRKLREMGRELTVIKHREAITRRQLEIENEFLIKQLQEK